MSCLLRERGIPPSKRKGDLKKCETLSRWERNAAGRAEIFWVFYGSEKKYGVRREKARRMKYRKTSQPKWKGKSRWFRQEDL